MNAALFRRAADAIEAGCLPKLQDLDRLERLLRAIRGKDQRSPVVWRREMLGRVYSKFYHGMARSAAADLIAVAWSEAVRTDGEALPDTEELYYRRLARGGCTPKCARTIYTDLK